MSGPQDAEFIRRFLTERVAAVIEAEPDSEAEAMDWLETRNRQVAENLNVTVDHLDVLVDSRKGG